MGVNIKDVAMQAGVSPSTVSRVIANHPRISQETRDRVRLIMKEMDYHPNAIARSLVKRSSEVIGLLIPSTIEQFYLNPFFPEVLRGITQVAQHAGYDIFLSTALHGLNDVDRLEKLIRSKRVDGMILLTSRTTDPLLELVTELRIPSVLIGRPFNSLPISWINNDNRLAAHDMTQHLIRMGHRRIGYIGGSQELVVSLDRLRGYSDALFEADLKLDPQCIVSGEFLEDVGYSGMMRLLALAERPTAVVASDDVLAFGAMRAAGELGYSIPDDLAIVGFNDIPLAKLSNPPMTTVNVNIYELGVQATHLLLDEIQGSVRGPKHQIIEHQLVIRRSCGAWDPLTQLQGDESKSK
ncbi:LacI family DNA-binding transcriptional regulator [Ferroacidibacillus organovorans]|uniref:LacI family transcriptional regulator n=1 Tax=Ferroacidibacillus organovorans TaxID=1765683 RepID=A0A853KFM6_9BACL|nr:LacI family DNA-binding transcriptional regulator [Ferroacidibacillus organovorans]KYP81414.1 LacI family transcriptional regulator [Ferroacidibacillus organovorans]OAG95201.1 LacI family transcriptional regulator [Ferroacidibacillus organovorans]